MAGMRAVHTRGDQLRSRIHERPGDEIFHYGWKRHLDMICQQGLSPGEVVSMDLQRALPWLCPYLGWPYLVHSPSLLSWVVGMPGMYGPTTPCGSSASASIRRRHTPSSGKWYGRQSPACVWTRWMVAWSIGSKALLVITEQRSPCACVAQTDLGLFGARHGHNSVRLSWRRRLRPARPWPRLAIRLDCPLVILLHQLPKCQSQLRPRA